jgi:hypothetical protein
VRVQMHNCVATCPSYTRASTRTPRTCESALILRALAMYAGKSSADTRTPVEHDVEIEGEGAHNGIAATMITSATQCWLLEQTPAKIPPLRIFPNAHKHCRIKVLCVLVGISRMTLLFPSKGAHKRNNMQAFRVRSAGFCRVIRVQRVSSAAITGRRSRQVQLILRQQRRAQM